MSTSNTLLLVTTLTIALAILAVDYVVIYRPRWRRPRLPNRGGAVSEAKSALL